jgi:hypothetical protein
LHCENRRIVPDELATPSMVTIRPVQDLAGSRGNQRCADPYCAIAICHELEGAPVKIVDVEFIRGSRDA